MKVSKAGKIWLDYHQINSKKNADRSYLFPMERLCNKYGDDEGVDLSVENILDVTNRHTEGLKPQI